MSIVGALYGVFGRLSQHAQEAVEVQASRAGVKAEQLKPALEYIEKNYGGQVTLEVLARETGLSPKYFCRCFRAVTHRSPIDYLNHYRIECASFLLTSSDMTIAEIAQRCGYSDSSFFIKQFKRYKGTTPKKYRTGTAQ
jgi:AraC-like DNA-binding protein